MNRIIGDPNIRDIQWTTFGETVLNPVALLLTIAMAILILVINRRYAIIPMLIIATVITNMQRIVIAGFDFDMIRILIIAAMIRVVLRNEFHSIKFNAIDWLVLVWLVIRFTSQALLWKTSGRIVYNLGYTYNAIGMYYLCRMFIRDRSDIKIALVSLIITTIVVGLEMLVEQLTGNNLFALFGGVPARTLVREGRLRSQAAFSHPILAGSFGAGIIPLAWAMFRDRANVTRRRIGFIGLFTSPLIVITASSSGPLLAFMAGLFGIFMWRYRLYTRTFYWLGLLVIILLDLYMDSPVYSLIWRVTVVGGSTGYHRYMLIHQAVLRFREWWLIGIQSNAHWGWGLQDVTNMFIRQGIDSGFFGMLAFILVNVFSFRAVSVIVKRNPGDYGNRLVWAIGVSLLAHVASFFGVSYFGQMMFFWYITVAMIASLWQNEAVPFGEFFFRREPILTVIPRGGKS